jgi:hypothetical protein
MAVHHLKNETIDPTGARSFPNIAIETKMIIDHLKDKPEGAIVTYAELASLIGRSVMPGERGYGYVQSAKRILLRDFNVVVDSEPKVGFKVCTNDEKMTVSGRDLKRARRATRRSEQKLDAVNYARLGDKSKKEWNARKSVLGALNLMNTPKAVQRVEAAIEGQILPSAKTLELFRN